MFIPISEKRFVELTGQLGTEIVRRHSNGSSWLTPDGRFVAAVGKQPWRYYVMTEKF